MIDGFLLQLVPSSGLMHAIIKCFLLLPVVGKKSDEIIALLYSLDFL
jgi:hypothetical protein